ncbi:hypothetical protein [Microvirga puerhi]|uniref:Uncharacterized protein n=1 Tax=Microvirga puerhi TaxID=2876078 RepID=A0ABS7VPB7_9HYPH|nr:hypothetical protein [Microvirga puerhi]MBZ6077354.1 hypothetical protein [Microvirga puerhi]
MPLGAIHGPSIDREKRIPLLLEFLRSREQAYSAISEVGGGREIGAIATSEWLSPPFEAACGALPELDFFEGSPPSDSSLYLRTDAIFLW